MDTLCLTQNEAGATPIEEQSSEKLLYEGQDRTPAGDTVIS